MKKEYIQPSMIEVQIQNERILDNSIQSQWIDTDGTYDGSDEEEEM